MTSKTDQLSALVEHGADPKGNIVLTGEVDDEMVDRLTRALIALGPARDLHIRLNSDGGDVDAALSIYDLLRDHRGHVTCTVTCRAWSAAVVILQAADDRVLLPNATLMIHDGAHHGAGVESVADHRAGVAFDEQQARKFDRILLARIQERRPTFNAKALLAWNVKTKYLFAADAVDHGLADRVQYPDAGSHLDEEA